MARTYLEAKDVVVLLRNEVKRIGSQIAWSQAHGYDRTVLNTILNGRRDITAPLIKLLNLGTAYTPASRERDLKILDEDDVLALLREDIDKVGGQARWARLHKHGRSHLNRVLVKKKPLTPDIIKLLKLKPIYFVDG
jgi:hypothetical protein